MRQIATENVSPPVVQRSLQVSQPGDRWEREADEMADEVMRMPDTGLSATRAWGAVQRCPDGSCSPDDDRPELMRAVDASATAGADSIEALRSLGGSRPLGSRERSFFEPRFNRDFSRVRVHDTPESAQVAKSFGALAFTSGRRIAFGAGAYRPGTRAGHHLLAHELTHVVQQGAARGTREEGA
jgi:hypothetical protein